MKKINGLVKKPNVSPKVRELLEQISGFDNVPRKKAKFQNWMKNSLKVHNESILEQVWTIFSEASSTEPVSKGQDQQAPSQATNPCAENSAPSKVSDTRERPAEAKKNRRERKEERQKNRKKEKKELRLEDHQEKAKNQKPKKRKEEADLGADLEAAGMGAPEANGSIRKKSKKRHQGQPAGERPAGEEGLPATGARGPSHQEEAERAAGKRKRTFSEVETNSKKKKVKFSGHSEGAEPEDHVAPAKGKFNWKGTIKAILKQAPDNEISIKKLRKKVLAQYHMASSERHRSEEELLVIFNKKISRNPTFKLLKDKVKLLK
ncbi:cell growth-regulating nucleolar protein isoform X2 [Nycticebus coucang]|uniref:cell growth-regulating nucleolar protein isoform X2 n=1 Tax=Nycticebus coucang TaxID=9470 RepID=UPI00234C3046|nr:cell growth-regulating nucleolar protein isoform X2 [Nycticebus coucang]